MRFSMFNTVRFASCSAVGALAWPNLGVTKGAGSRCSELRLGFAAGRRAGLLLGPKAGCQDRFELNSGYWVTRWQDEEIGKSIRFEAIRWRRSIFRHHHRGLAAMI